MRSALPSPLQLSCKSLFAVLILMPPLVKMAAWGLLCPPGEAAVPLESRQRDPRLASRSQSGWVLGGRP